MDFNSGALQERKEGDHGALLHSENGDNLDIEMKIADGPGEFSWDVHICPPANHAHYVAPGVCFDDC
jgi:hypothetical protein